MPGGIHGGEVTAIVAGHGFGALATRYNVAYNDAGWSSLVARRAHNPKVAGSNPAPATNENPCVAGVLVFLRVWVSGPFWTPITFR